jgi:hypothetical protein
MPRAQNTTSDRPDDAITSMRPVPEEIAARAFDLYQRRGATDGADVDDWLEAERQLVQEQRDGVATA